MANPHTAETEAPSRIYFNVIDEAGHVHPAVEYWAATFDDGKVPFQIIPVSRFLRILGSNEALTQLDAARFKGCRTGRVFVRGSSHGKSDQGGINAPADNEESGS
jgi:hypothetical protein